MDSVSGNSSKSPGNQNIFACQMSTNRRKEDYCGEMGMQIYSGMQFMDSINHPKVILFIT